MEDRPPQEAELVARARRGEWDAYEEIVRLHQTIAFRTADLQHGDRRIGEEDAR